MNILELESYNLADAVKFHDELNPRIWDESETMRTDVRNRLLEIAEDFRVFLGVPDLNVVDITVSGSNAAYTYTPHSDIDLHLVVDIPELNDEVYRELFDAKKSQYNSQHHITIGGYDVELYAQDADENPKSNGIYSIVNNEWISVPKRRRADIDDGTTKAKYEKVKQMIEDAIDSKDYDTLKEVSAKIRKMRQTGLATHGEFGPENLAFKILRTQGYIQKLHDARNAAKDAMLSLAEREKQMVARRPTVYGYGPEEKVKEDAGMSPSGVSPLTKMFLSEEPKTPEKILSDFIEFCTQQLELENTPRFKIKRDPEWSKRNKTFGRFNQESGVLEVSIANRHIMDVLRTVAHELVHQRQAEIAPMPAGAGETGSDYENEANALAGVLMRDYGGANPELFASFEELDEGWKQKAAAAAATAALAAGSGAAQGQSIQSFLGPAIAAGTASQTFKGVNWGQMLGGEAQNAITQYSQTDLPVQLSKMKKPQAPVAQQVQPDDDAWTSNDSYKRNNPAFSPGIKEDASGYIPTKKQARDPRFSMALTADVKPGTLGKVANTYKLNTDSQGRPQIANPNGLVKRLKEELALFKKK